MLQRWLLLWLVLSSLAALVWPVVGLSIDPFVDAEPLLPWMIGVTMFCIGSLIPKDEVEELIKRWPVVLGGTVIQFASMPLLAWALTRISGIDGPLAIGIVMVGCVPGAMASNVLTLAARGHVSYSVSLTTSATLLSPLVVPFVLKWTLGATHQLDTLDVFMKLLKQVVGPVIAGHLIARTLSNVGEVMKRLGPIVANIVILWIIGVVVGLNRDRLAEISATMLVVLLLINLGGYTAGWFGGTAMKLPHQMRRALSLEVGMQNAGLGTSLVIGLFPDQPTAAIPTAAYTFGCMLTGTILAAIWSRQEGPE